MARRGSFTAQQLYFGAPLSVVHPIDNKVPQYDPELEKLNLTDQQKIDYEQQISELTAALILARDYQS